MNQITKVCPNCHRENEADALYCTWKCGYKWPKPEPKPEPKPVPMTQEIRDAFFDFSENILTQIKKEINDCESRQQPVTYIFSDTDDQLRGAYKEYTANFRQLVATMDNIALLSKQIDDKYNACLGETEGANNAQIDYIRLKYEQVQNKIKESLSVLVNNVLEIDPFSGVINYQISPLERWKTIKASEPRFPQRYNYVGCVNYDYNILGISYHLFCHQFIELLNANNLIVHYNNASKQLAINVIKTLLARMLHISQGMHLKIGVIDTATGQGLGGRFNDLPKDIYTFYGPQDSNLIREYLIDFEVNADNLMSNVLSNTTAENYNKHSSNPVDNEVAVLLDWNSCLQESVNGNLVKDIMRKSVRTGKCVIVMVNDDMPYVVNRRSGEDELLPELEKSSIQLDVKEANGTVGALKKLSWDYETIDDAVLFDVVKVVRNKHAETKHKTTINIEPVLKRQLEYGGNSSLGLSFVVGKNESYQDVTLELEDGGPGASLLVSANHNSELLLPWVQALIAQAMAQYKPEELKLVFADFTDDDVFDGLFDKNVETPPYYYYSGDGVQNKLRACLEKHKTQGQGRMLVFLNCDYLGCTDFVNNYSCLNKIHLILIERHNEQCLMSYSDWHNHFINFGPIWDHKWHIEKNQFELEESLCTAYSWDNVSELKELIEDWAESYRTEHPDEIVLDEDEDDDEEDMGYEVIEQNDIEENNIPSFEDLDEEMTEMDIVDSKTDEDTTNDNGNSNSNEMVVTDEAVEHGQTDAVESSSAEAQVEPTKALPDQIAETTPTVVKPVVVPMKKEDAPAKKLAKKKKTTKKQTTEFGYQ